MLFGSCIIAFVTIVTYTFSVSPFHVVLQVNLDRCRIRALLTLMVPSSLVYPHDMSRHNIFIESFVVAFGAFFVPDFEVDSRYMTNKIPTLLGLIFTEFALKGHSPLYLAEL